MNKLGDIILNSKPYRISRGTSKDLTDFSPRGTGTQSASELGLYQPIEQTDWRHGFGWQWWTDEMGYQVTDGNIDTRQDGIVMMSTASTSSDTDNAVKEGFVTWNGAVWAWGASGLRKYDAGYGIGATSDVWGNVFSVADLDSYSITLQPPTADTYISKSAATTNYGTSTTLLVGEANDASDAVCRSLLKFDFSDIPKGAVVTTATLSVYLTSSAKATNNRVMSAYRMKQDWNVQSATWNVYITGKNWATAGAQGANDYFSTAIGTVNVVAGEGAGWKDITLDAATVQAMIVASPETSIRNSGIMLSVATESNDQYAFASGNNGTAANRPKLVIDYTSPAIGATDTVRFAYPAGDYLFYCPDGWRIRKINKEDKHTYAGNDANARDYKWMVLHNGFLYAGRDNSNRVHRDSTSDLSDLEGTTADPDVIYVGNTNDRYATIGAVSYAGNLYVSRADGLWMIGEDKIARRVLDFSAESSDDNFRSMAVYNGYLMFPIRDRFYQWNGARLSDVTPPRITDSFPYTTYGRFDNLVAAGKFLYCTARTNESTYNEDLLVWDGVAWHKLMRLATSTDTITAMGYDASRNYMWYHKQATADITYYIPFQAHSDFPYAAFPTTGTHSLITSRIDAGFRRVKKSTPSMLVEAKNVNATRYITVQYSLDGGTWTTWGNIIANGITELTLSTTIEYFQIRLKFIFVTDTAAQSPILESYTLRFLMRPDEFYGWAYTIPIAKGQDVGVGMQVLPTHDIITNLKTARASKSPITLIDEFGETYKVYVTSLSSEIIEWDKDDGGTYPNVEKVIQLNLTEAR
jgi:hypothetical protein